VAVLALVAASGAAADTLRATSGFGPADPIAFAIHPELSARLQEPRRASSHRTK
jgi:hypothetical protein